MSSPDASSLAAPAPRAASGRYLETYQVGSWEEHERQHARATQHDASLLQALDGLLVPGTHRVAHHFLAAPESRR